MLYYLKKSVRLGHLSQNDMQMIIINVNWSAHKYLFFSLKKATE